MLANKYTKNREEDIMNVQYLLRCKLTCKKKRNYHMDLGFIKHILLKDIRNVKVLHEELTIIAFCGK